jgi:hypothetical protein
MALEPGYAAVVFVESMGEGGRHCQDTLLRQWSLSETDVRKNRNGHPYLNSRFIVPSELAPSKPPTQSPLCSDQEGNATK